MTDIPPPAELNEFVQALGPDDTLRLIEACGGTRVYVPGYFDVAKPAVAKLVEQFGSKMVRAMVQRWGGDSLKVPLIRWWRIQVYHARGMSYPAIARAAGCTETTVWRQLSACSLTNQMTLDV